MDLGIRGRKALLCGASRGLGKACALALAQEGVDITIVARTRDVLERTADEIRRARREGHAGRGRHHDAAGPRRRRSPPARRPTFWSTTPKGRLPGDFRTWTRDDWISALDTMMLCHIEMMRLTVDGMMARGFGRIVNIASRSVKIPQLELGPVERRALRAGRVSWRVWRARRSKHNVTINNLLPGPFDTDAQREHVQGMVDASNSFEKLWQARVAQNPGRPLRAAQHELGAYCAFLCSAQAGYITGQNLLIDGGSYPGTY